MIRSLLRRALAPLLLAPALLPALAPVPAYAAGNLMVTPTRVVLSGAQRGTVLSLVNTGTAPMTYRISLVFRRMTAAGELETVTTPNAAEQAAAKLIRYSPREVTLAPGVTQNVRVQIRKPASLAAGEYRVHMLFLEVPPAESADATVSALNGEKPKDVALKLTQIFGVSIPLIVRHGDTTADLRFDGMAIEPPAKAGDKPTLRFDLHRLGNRSVYGEMSAVVVGADGQEKPVGQLANVAVYTPLDHRTLRMPLEPLTGLHGKLRLRFQETSPPSDKPLAQAEMALP